MTKFWTVLAASAALVSVPAFAQPSDAQGKIQIKLLGTAVLPHGKITDVRTDLLGLPPTAQTKASDSFVPTIAAEYFLTPQFSIETICCVTPHEVQGAGPIAGTKLVKNAVILPATVTLKYHLETGAGFKPYIGAGPSYFFIFGEDVDAGAAGLGLTNVNLSDDFGFALQAGTDIKINDKGLGLTLDAKRYFIDTTARFRAGDVTRLETRHKLDPWVLSAGLAYRF